MGPIWGMIGAFVGRHIANAVTDALDKPENKKKLDAAWNKTKQLAKGASVAIMGPSYPAMPAHQFKELEDFCIRSALDIARGSSGMPQMRTTLSQLIVDFARGNTQITQIMPEPEKLQAGLMIASDALIQIIRNARASDFRRITRPMRETVEPLLGVITKSGTALKAGGEGKVLNEALDMQGFLRNIANAKAR